MKIVYVDYEMPGPDRMPFSAAPDKDGKMWIPEFGGPPIKSRGWTPERASGQQAVVNLKLEVGATQEQVTVTSDAEIW